MNLEEYESIQPNTEVEGLIFLTPNRQCAWRIQTLYTKEPDTIEWLRKMRPGEVLFDVGANIGQYSLLAAKAGVIVHAFEPEAQNFALLVKNFAINKEKLAKGSIAWPLSLSDKLVFSVFYLSTVNPGGSCHSFGAPIDFRGEAKQFAAEQGSVGIDMDSFVKNWSIQPTHIKIDVDGFEHLVIRGAKKTLEKVKSCLIEINTQYPEHMEEILPTMANLGFEYDAAQAESSRRKEGPFTGVGNIIFYKN